MSDDEKIYMSDELVGRVNIEGHPDFNDIEKNTVLITVKYCESLLIAGVKYFRREKSQLVFEVKCQIDTADEFISLFERGEHTVDFFELQRGNNVIIHLDELGIENYYLCDVDATIGQVMFGLKLVEKKKEVL